MERGSVKSATPAVLNIAVTVLALLVIAAFGIRTIGPTSLWTHLSTGRLMNEEGEVLRTDQLSLTRGGEDAVFSSWMYDRMVHRIWQFSGPVGTTIFHIACVIAAFMILIPLARKWSDYPAIALSLLLCGWMISFIFKPSPSLAIILFAAVFIKLLHGRTSPVALWVVLPLSQILWTNMSTSFLIGPALILAMAVQAFFTKGKGDMRLHRPRTYLILAGACILATLINPYGFGLHRHTFSLWNEPALAYVNEWISPYASHFRNNIPSTLLVITLLIGAIGLITYRDRLPIMLTLVVAILTFMSVRSLRYIDMLAVLTFPFICLAMQAMLNSIGGIMVPGSKYSTVLPGYIHSGLALLISILTLQMILSNNYYSRTGSDCRFGLGIENSAVPVAAAQIMGRPGFPSRILNMPSDGGYLSWSLPEKRIFIDERASLFGAELYRQLNAALLGDEEAWSSIVEANGVDAIIIPCSNNAGGIIYQNIKSSPDWTLIFFDGISAVFIRNLEIYHQFATDRKIHNKGLQLLDSAFRDYKENLGSGRRLPNSTRLIGAGNVFFTTGKLDNARSIFDMMTIGSPNMTGGWLIAGLTRVRAGQDIDRAIYALERAVRLNPNMALAWMWLSVCYEQKGSIGSALVAYERGLEIDPELASAFSRPGRTR